MKHALSNRLNLIFLPIFVLAFWVGMLAYNRANGTLITMPIRGYDPRDIFAGQYLRITLDYGNENKCVFTEPDCFLHAKNRKERRRCNRMSIQIAYFCADTKKFVTDRTLCSSTFIKGKCQWHWFNDGIRRFYIPEGQARALERAIADAGNKPEILLSVSKNGEALPVDLILNKKPWREWVKVQNVRP